MAAGNLTDFKTEGFSFRTPQISFSQTLKNLINLKNYSAVTQAVNSPADSVPGSL